MIVLRRGSPHSTLFQRDGFYLIHCGAWGDGVRLTTEEAEEMEFTSPTIDSEEMEVTQHVEFGKMNFTSPTVDSEDSGFTHYIL